jgi:hypothetical protein
MSFPIAEEYDPWPMKGTTFPAAAALLLCGMNAYALTALPLHEAPSGLFGKKAIATLCQAGPNPCAPESTRAYVAGTAPPDRVLLIDDAKPLIIEVVREGRGEYRARNALNLSGYRHSFEPEGGRDRGEPLRIYPALYPTGQGSFAIAVISTVRDMYSGGGASFEVADFLRFIGRRSGEPGTAFEAVYLGVPFSCSKMIRACFSEREYASSRHCHDESTGTLHIRYAFDNAGNPDWSFRWRQTEWPAHVGRKHRDTTDSVLKIPRAIDASPKASREGPTDFCGVLDAR